MLPQTSLSTNSVKQASRIFQKINLSIQIWKFKIVDFNHKSTRDHVKKRAFKRKKNVLPEHLLIIGGKCENSFFKVNLSVNY